MTQKQRKRRIWWTAQSQRKAELLSALGFTYREIARRLNCDPSTVRRRLRNIADPGERLIPEILEQYERFDLQRNIEEVVLAPSGSPQQARLRGHLRQRLHLPVRAADDDENAKNEDLDDDELCAELERLVGRPVILKDQL